jgi:hypothetical protein
MKGRCDHVRCGRPFGLKHPPARSYSLRFCSDVCKKAHKRLEKEARAERRAARLLYLQALLEGRVTKKAP